MKIKPIKKINILLQILMIPRFISTFLHESGHARKIIKANKKLAINEKVIVIIGCRALLRDTNFKHNVFETKNIIYVFFNNWWYYPDNAKTIGFTECSDHLKYDNDSIKSIAKAGIMNILIIFPCIIIILFSLCVLSLIYSNLTAFIILFYYMSFFFILAILEFTGLKEKTDYKNYKHTENFKIKKSEYDEILNILKRNKN